MKNNYENEEEEKKKRKIRKKIRYIKPDFFH